MDCRTPGLLDLGFVGMVSSLPKQKHSQLWSCLGMFLLFFLEEIQMSVADQNYKMD